MVELRTIEMGTVEVEISEGLSRATDEEILTAIKGVEDISALRTALYQLTGEEQLRDLPVSVEANQGVDRVIPPSISDAGALKFIKERAFELAKSYRDGTAVPRPACKAELLDLLRLMFGHDFALDEVDQWWEEFACEPFPRRCEWYGTLPPEKTAGFQVVVIGAGMSGISAAVALTKAGIPYRIIEKNGGLGGTWYENTYPGARVDLHSRSYSYTFEPNYPWKHHYATQDELQDYFAYVAEKYGIHDHVEFDSEVESAKWDEVAKHWNLEVRTRGVTRTVTTNVVISAVGIFNRPIPPDIVGVNGYRGHVMHTARWDHEVDLTGKRVAVIGTGSSGVQVTAPLAERVGHLAVFQRAGVWVANIPNYIDEVAKEEQWMLDNFPYYANWVRLSNVHVIGDTRIPYLEVDPNWTDPDTVSELNFGLRKALVSYVMAKLGDRPDLVDKCIPKYPPLSKRIPKDNGWFDALRRPNVDLVTESIDRITADGIRTKDGVERQFDVIVFATGFNANAFLWPINFEGRRGATLEKVWSKDGARAYLGITIPGFPNLFCLYGPNTNGKTGGPAPKGEMQARYALGACKLLIEGDLHSMEVREEVYQEFNERIDTELETTIWMDPRQRSYYRNDFGRVATNGSSSLRDYWHWTLAPNPDDFVID